MDNENEKLTKIRKSSHYGRIASRVLLIIGIVAVVLSLATGIGILSSNGRFDEWIQSQDTEVQNKIGSADLFNIDLKLGSPTDLHLESDIPAVQKEIAEHPYAVFYGAYILAVSLLAFYYCVVTFMFMRAFKIIENSPSPFTPEVKKGLLIPLIGVAVIVAVTISGGFAIIAALLIWVINSILDYGISLQKQYDETL